MVDPRVRYALIAFASLAGVAALIFSAWWALFGMVALLVGQVYELRHQRGRS